MNKLIENNQPNEIEVVQLDYGTTGLCGSVASLLKVLTKTMEKQGSHISDIARVQKSICEQMGIILPDVFITDCYDALEEIDDFIEKWIDCGTNYKISQTELVTAYQEYCKSEGKPPISKTMFLRKIRKFTTSVQIKGYAYIVGTKLKDTERITLIQCYLDNLNNDKVCVSQICKECLGQTEAPTRELSNAIHEIMRSRIIGWVEIKNKSRFGTYGAQIGYERILGESN